MRGHSRLQHLSSIWRIGPETCHLGADESGQGLAGRAGKADPAQSGKKSSCNIINPHAERASTTNPISPCAEKLQGEAGAKKTGVGKSRTGIDGLATAACCGRDTR